MRNYSGIVNSQQMGTSLKLTSLSYFRGMYQIQPEK